MSDHEDGYTDGLAVGYERGWSAAADKIAEQAKRIKALEEVIAEMAQDPMGEYYTGLRCGVEDRNISDRYEAAEYGWQEAFEYIGSIAAGYGEVGR